MSTTAHSKPIQVLDGCVVYDYYGVRFIAAPELPPSPYRCPRCAAPFWSALAGCSGRNDSHPAVRVVAQNHDYRGYQGYQGFQDSTANSA